MTYLYAIRDSESGYVKIGYSINPHDRLRELQTGSGGKLELIHSEPVADRCARLLEQSLHRELNPLRVRGEWFRIDESFARNAIVHHIIRWGNGID